MSMAFFYQYITIRRRYFKRNKEKLSEQLQPSGVN